MNVPQLDELLFVLKEMGYEGSILPPDLYFKKLRPPAIHFYDCMIVDKEGKHRVLHATETYICARVIGKGYHRYRKRFKYSDYVSIYDLLEAALVYTDKVIINKLWTKLKDNDKTTKFEELYTVIKSPRKSESIVRGYGGMINGVYTK